MVIVQRHGRRSRVLNPVTRKWNEIINVTFVEPDRVGGANPTLSNSSQALSQVMGINVGLNQFRTHTQPVLASAIDEFQIGLEIPELFINRTLYSQPQMQQQEGVEPRMIDGQPTYFVTELSTEQKDDTDKRMEKNVLATVDKSLFTKARTRQAVVETLEERFSDQEADLDNNSKALQPVETRGGNTTGGPGGGRNNAAGQGNE